MFNRLKPNNLLIMQKKIKNFFILSRKLTE